MLGWTGGTARPKWLLVPVDSFPSDCSTEKEKDGNRQGSLEGVPSGVGIGTKRVK